MNLASCTEAIRAKTGTDSGLDASVRFDCGAEGSIYIDGKTVPNSVSNSTAQADCTISISIEDLTALLNGELDPATGFMTGRLRVAGDMGVAMRLQSVI